MTQVLNEAAIKVSLDASEVEAGGAKIEQVGARTKKTLESLGGTSGFKNIGDGAVGAAGQMDRATATMAASIQRATAAMNAGAKGSADYYAALANSRGLNVAALRPYLDQLDAVTRKTAAAAEAQRQLETSARFLDGLRSQAEGIGKTASQLAALRAEQLGVTEAARPFIEQLREAEDAAGGAEDSFGGLAQAVSAIALGGGVAAVAQLSDEYGKFVAQLQLATDGQTEFQNAQNAVRRIATTAQADLSATASLYANITKGTRDLGIAQTEVANITETVSLALKVSGATGAEAASAILQLSQAFASGTLRGDEFNSVNEAAPRLMQALADGIGVPVGALRKMAEEGQLTTAVLADALPRALGTLREEAKSVESIAGAYTVLKNNILEMVGATAQSNGVVAALSGSINLLAENLTLAAGAMATVVAVKLGASLAAATREAYASVAANQARLTSNVAAARADVAATASASALAAARVAELRASVLAADGAVALAIATNGLIPAQARATAASAAHTAALAAQTAAMGAASVAGRAVSGAMALLGGPVGAVIALLGVAATAWAVWGDSAEKSEQKVSETTEATTEEVIASLDKQIAKLKERNRLASIGFKPADIQAPGGEKLAEVVGQIDRAGKGEGEFANLNLEARTEILRVLGKQYGELTTRIAEFNRESEIETNNKNKKSAGEWMQKYATNAEKLSAELKKAKDELGNAFTPELEARIRKQFETKDKGLAKEISAYNSLLEAVNERVAATAREAAAQAPLTEAQKLQARIDGEVASGKLKLNAAQKAALDSRLKEVSTNEEVIASQKRAAQGAVDWLKIQKDYDDTAKRNIDNAVKEAERNEELARTFGMTKSAVEQLGLARLEEQLAQRSSLGLTLDEIENLEKLIDAKRRSAAALGELEVKEANKKAADQAVKDWERSSEQIGQSLADNIMRGGKSAAEYIRDLFRTMVLRPVIQAVTQPMANQIAGFMQGGSQGGGSNPVSGLSSLYSLFGSTGAKTAGTTAAGGASSALSGVASYGGWIAAGMALADGLYKKGWDPNNGTVSKGMIYTEPLTGSSTILNEVFKGLGMNNKLANLFSGASITSALFGRKNPEIESQGFQGTVTASGFDGNAYANILEKGGIFRSDKRYTQTAALGADQDKSLDATVKAMIDAAKGFASTLGLEASVIEGYNKQIKLELTKDEAKNQEAIAKLFGEIGDDLSTRLVPSIKEFSAAGETASATLQRLVTNYATVDEALKSIGTQFGAVGVASLSARERLIDASGGLEAFAANTAGFQQNFLTESERLAPVIKSVAEQLASMGLSSVDTRKEFQQVVLGLDLTTEAGAKQYGALMKLQAAFALVYPEMEDTAAAAKAAADALAATNKGYQDQIDELLRARMSPEDRRKAEIAGMDPSTVGVYDTLAALKAQDALKATNQSFLDQIHEIDRATMSAIELREDDIKGMDATTVALYDLLQAKRKEVEAVSAQKAAYDQAAQAIKAAAESAKAMAQSFGNAVVDAMNRATASAKAIREFSDSLLLGNLSTLDPDAKYREAKKQFEAADPSNTAAAQAFLQASKDRGADSFYYERDFALVQEKLLKGAKALDDYAARLPDFYRGAAQAMTAPVITPPVAPPVVQQSGTMSKESASQANSGLEQRMDKMIDRLGKLEAIAESTSKTAEYIDRVTEGGNAMVVAN